MSDKFQVIWIDNLITRKTILKIGDNVIGNIIDVNDENNESLIQKAAVINVSPDEEITITPCNGISCYVKSVGTLGWKFSGHNWCTTLKLRDTCLLFPVKIWLKVFSTMEEPGDHLNHKRKLEEIEDDEPLDKRCRTETDLEIEPSLSFLNNSNHEPLDEQDDFLKEVENNCNNNNIDEISPEVTNTLETISEVQLETLLPSTSTNNENQDIKDDDDQSKSEVDQPNSNNDVTNITTQNVVREKCTYGDKCYRLSEQHKTKFCHPGDTDYNLIDSKPECPYGNRCYRKNPQHKLNYKHTSSKRKPAPKKPDSPLDLSEDEYSDESVDESDYEPSFIDDNSDYMDDVSTDSENEL